ncbi:hypothetical protein [Pontibacter vulgaris]|uniref:hypothetical protein n=1 Tax=Pontibacter vulgaris TaxID=2905679 RepID=UPI001FA7270A|nr:hypothetical protein [Pontibacter vulgaris]
MKKALFVLMAFVVFFGTACEKLDELLTFYINEDETIKIESNFPIGAVVPLTPVAVTTNSQETFKNNNTRAELVKDVTLNKLTLTISDPQGQNFNFLKNIEIYISNSENGDTRLAYLDEIPQNVSSLTLKSTNAQLDKYIKSDSYTIKTKATLAKPISQDISIRADMRFKVTADPI